MPAHEERELKGPFLKSSCIVLRSKAMHMKGEKAKMCVFDEFLPTFCGQKVGSVLRQETLYFYFKGLFISNLRLVKK